MVGTVVLVARGGKLAYARAAGYADREAGHPIKLGTPFRLSSVINAFTTAAAAKLIEPGVLDPAQPTTAWLPAFRPALQDGTMPRITVDHLMSHTAGLGYGFRQPANGPYARAGVSDGLDNLPISLADNLVRIASVPLDAYPARPGVTRWRPTSWVR